MGTRTLGTETLWEEIWPTMPGERHRSAFKTCKEKGVTLFCFELAKGRRIRSWAFFWALLYICSPSVAILYLILILKTPCGRHQPRYINGEPEAQRGWDIGPGCQEIVNGRPASRAACPLHCTMLCLLQMIWRCRRQWKLGDKEEGEGMTYCPSLKTFESKRSILDNQAWTIRAKWLPWHSRPVGLLTEDATVAAHCQARRCPKTDLFWEVR